MTKNEKLAVVGATGNVGRKIIDLLVEREVIDPANLKLLASAKSAGKMHVYAGKHYPIADVAKESFDDCRLIIFATDSDISKIYIPSAVQRRIYVIDTSSAFRLTPNVPLIVPPVNLHEVTVHQYLYATANCVACPIAVMLAPLHHLVPIKRVVVSTYQSASGAGKAAMDELFLQTQGIYTHENYPAQCFPRPIAFNVIPQIDKLLEDGFTNEEFKIMREVQKVVDNNIAITATAVRVPVMIGHAISLAIEFAEKITVEEVKKFLANSKGIKLSAHDYTTPLEVVGKDEVYVGRLRQDPSLKNGILLWSVSDNLRRGAALDAVEIAEKIFKT